jgi:hypothetical protein
MIRLTKIEAARRQLETATLLYFDEGDPVSIHTLAGAAHELVSKLAEKAGEMTPVHGSLVASLPEDLVSKLRTAIRAPQNFFKHADRQPEAVLEFSPELSEMILLDAMATYGKLTSEIPWLFEAFTKWFGLKHPEWFGNAPQTEALLRAAKESVDLSDRKSFFRQYRDWLKRTPNWASKE